MKFYKVSFRRDPNGTYVYPEGVRGVAWRNLHYHSTDLIMIGETENDIAADGTEVISLTEQDARALVDKFRTGVQPPMAAAVPAKKDKGKGKR